MPLGFATLPLGPHELRALSDGDYSIIDQAMRTPGLLIIQAPDGEASGAGRQASEGATVAAEPDEGEPFVTPEGPAPDARRLAPEE